MSKYVNSVCVCDSAVPQAVHPEVETEEHVQQEGGERRNRQYKDILNSPPVR